MRTWYRGPLSELGLIAPVILDHETRAARERMSAGGKRGRKVRKFSGPSEALERTGMRFGISGRSLRKILDICAAAQADPERFGYLVEEMDRTGKVHPPHTKLLEMRRQISQAQRDLSSSCCTSTADGLSDCGKLTAIGLTGVG